MKKFLGFVGFLGVLIGSGSLAYGNEVTVYPGGATYTTIQAGINACPVGGTVSVAAGTYTEAVTINNKRIAVVGVDTPTIDPPADGAAVTFNNNGADNASISGFRITGATGGSGYGISYINGAEPQITNNSITGNSQYGIYSDTDSAPAIKDNTITNNSSYAIWLYANGLRNGVDNNTLSGNGYNNAISVWYDEVTSNTVWHNFGTETVYRIRGDGSERAVNVNSNVTLNIEPGCILKFEGKTGIHCYGTLTAIGNDPIVFTSINDDTYGGDTNGTTTPPAAGYWRGIRFYSTDAGSILKDVVVEYGGSDYSGNIYCDHASPIIQNSVIRYAKGAGVYLSYSNSEVSKNTIMGNEDGIYCCYGNPLVSRNDIIQNTAYGGCGA